MDSPRVARFQDRPGRRLFAVLVGGVVAFFIGGFPALGVYLFLAAFGGAVALAFSGRV